MSYQQQPYNFYDAMQHVEGQIRAYQERMDGLDKRMAELTKSLEQLKAREPININYSFDQLKIEKLDGTLNIGIKPGEGLGDLDEFAVKNQEIESQMSPDVVFQTPEEAGPNIERGMNVLGEIKSYLDHYFQEVAIKDLQGIEEKYNYPLDPPYRQFIIGDVRRQLDPRIDYYLRVFGHEFRESEDALAQQVISKIHDDIVKAFDLFIQNLPKGKGGTP